MDDKNSAGVVLIILGNLLYLSEIYFKIDILLILSLFCYVAGLILTVRYMSKNKSKKK